MLFLWKVFVYNLLTSFAPSLLHTAFGMTSGTDSCPGFTVMTKRFAVRVWLITTFPRTTRGIEAGGLAPDMAVGADGFSNFRTAFSAYMILASSCFTSGFIRNSPCTEGGMGLFRQCLVFGFAASRTYTFRESAFRMAGSPFGSPFSESMVVGILGDCFSDPGTTFGTVMIPAACFDTGGFIRNGPGTKGRMVYFSGCLGFLFTASGTYAFREAAVGMAGSTFLGPAAERMVVGILGNCFSDPGTAFGTVMVPAACFDTGGFIRNGPGTKGRMAYFGGCLGFFFTAAGTYAFRETAIGMAGGPFLGPAAERMVGILGNGFSDPGTAFSTVMVPAACFDAVGFIGDSPGTEGRMTFFG